MIGCLGGHEVSVMGFIPKRRNNIKNIYLLVKYGDGIGHSYIHIDEEYGTYGVTRYSRILPSITFHAENEEVLTGLMQGI